MTGRTWVLSISLSSNPSVLRPRAHTLLSGSLSLAIHSGFVPGFEDFLLARRPAVHAGNGLVGKLWELQGCR